MRNKKSWILKMICMLIPLLLGMVGLVVEEKQPFLDSLFHCIVMYGMNYGATPPNILVEIARWTAPLATASGILFAIVSLQETAVNYFKFLRGGSVAVYGSELEKEEMLQQLGKSGIDGGQRFVRAQRYILLNDEQENLAFYKQHQASLKEAKVYLKCQTLPVQSISEAGLKLFCPEETAARLYWKQRGLYTLSKTRQHHLQIVLIGFGKLGEELIFWGLQNNIFSPQQNIAYHIYGDCAAFMASHHELDHIEDAVIVHAEPWYENLAQLESADLLIVVQQNQQMNLLRDLLFSLTREKIDVFSANESMADLLAGKERLRCFDWEKEAHQLKHVFDDELFERAKRINLRYCHIYNGVIENEANKQLEWQKLDAFTRYSNVSSADYHDIRLQMLAENNEPTDGSPLSDQCLENLAELEHIRWCRYHYLNNWKYGVLDNGRRKDAAKRIHTDLISYDELSEEEKEKDRENIRILLSV